MSTQIQELIDKIKTEGIQEAQGKARDIESEARRRADEIVAQAQKKAGDIVAKAQSETQRLQEASRAALQQASRDALLSLRREIQSILNKIILNDLHQALAPEHLTEIIAVTIKNYLQQNAGAGDLTVILSEKDLQQLKDGFLARLKEQVKQPIHLLSAQDVGAGFLISFDGGKSSFDFTDKSLAEFLSRALNQELAALVKDSVA
ncbi:MAG: V-type ATP synthase subunit E family protein [Candidatus Omnitrophota bacterium]|nr:V-type ATP synthase subunit E family protein [Candidatus Omnitrophota bacterium]MDZ4242481.1 V-type ATP synthase subunit E family protein [Candidatus Omnitrophota bacterium]